MKSKKCARCDAILRYPEDAGIKGTTVIDGSVCEVDICGGCRMERRKFENMLCGCFGLRSVDDLYKVREIIENMHELFREDGD